MTTRDPWVDTPEAFGDEAPAQPDTSQWPGRKRRASDGEKRGAYIVLRAQFKTRCAAAYNKDGSVGLPCGICGKPIDYLLPWGRPDSFEVNHIEPVSKRPDLELVVANWEPSHSLCNKRLSAAGGLDGDEYDSGIEPSEDW